MFQTPMSQNESHEKDPTIKEKTRVMEFVTHFLKGNICLFIYENVLPK
jgi:hypothetical protein